jgi:hypothetical protein
VTIGGQKRVVYSSTNLNRDICLLQLTEPFKIGEDVQPICMENKIGEASAMNKEPVYLKQNFETDEQLLTVSSEDSCANLAGIHKSKTQICMTGNFSCPMIPGTPVVRVDSIGNPILVGIEKVENVIFSNI